MELFVAFIDSLGIPEICHLNQKLFKKQFYELAKPAKAHREQFAKEVNRIVWTHTLKKNTINIPPWVTERLEYLEIAYIHVDLKEKSHHKNIARIIHQIPYPVVLMLTYGDTLCISTALKHINQADISKMTVDEYFYSEWIDLDEPTTAQREFLESLCLKHLSFENFYKFYQGICDRIVALDAASLGVEFSTEHTSQKKQILDKIHLLEEETAALRRAIRKEPQFNAKVRLNMQLKQAEEKIEKLKSSL